MTKLNLKGGHYGKVTCKQRKACQKSIQQHQICEPDHYSLIA